MFPDCTTSVGCSTTEEHVQVLIRDAVNFAANMFNKQTYRFSSHDQYVLNL